MSGKLREFFPGGNTSCGFHSFYDFIIDKDATQILYLIETICQIQRKYSK
ncbi:MAG: hypothetical protein ACOWWO_04100 [Peptococcaceae bacterium]